MARTRAPGGGRKPKGPFKGKTAQLTTRIRPEVRSALDREAERNNRSVSQEVEYRLEQSLQVPKLSEKALGAPRNRALGHVVSRLAAGTELVTGENWRRDKFTFAELKSAIETVLSQFAPEGSVKTPPRIERTAHRTGKALMRGDIGTSVALGLLLQMEITEKPPLNYPKSDHYAYEYFLMPDLRQDLEFKPRKGTS